MKKIILLTSVSLFAWLGWKTGDRFGIMTAYMLAFAGSLLGVYVGVKIKSDLES